MENVQNLVPGIQFFLGIQLVLVAVVLFLLKTKLTRIPLGFLCLIAGLWFFKKVFDGVWSDNLLLFIVIGPGKPIYVGSLLLFYFKAAYQRPTAKYVLRHLWVPSLYYFLVIYFRYYKGTPIEDGIEYFSLGLSTAVFLIYLYYFVRTREEIRLEIRNRLKPRVYTRTKLLFYLIYFFLLQVPLWDLAMKLVVEPENNLLSSAASQNWLNPLVSIGSIVVYIYLHFLGYFLFLYGISEIYHFKKIISPSDVLASSKPTKNKTEIVSLLDCFMKEKKAYKDYGLTSDKLARMMDVSKYELLGHIKNEYNLNFKGYINEIRVEEVKSRIREGAYMKYDLPGLAKECGFKSKSTFYRVFKEVEGTTPMEYKRENAAPKKES